MRNLTASILYIIPCLLLSIGIMISMGESLTAELWGLGFAVAGVASYRACIAGADWLWKHEI